MRRYLSLALAFMLAFSFLACAPALAAGKPGAYTRAAVTHDTHITFTVDVTANGSFITDCGLLYGRSRDNLNMKRSLGSTYTGGDSALITNLVLDSGYWYYCTYATNAYGTTRGDVYSVYSHTSLKPEVSTGKTSLNNGKVVFSLDVGSGASSCGILFGTSAKELTRKKSCDSAYAGSHSVLLSLPGGTWYYRAFATNSSGTSLGTIKKVYISPSKVKAVSKQLDVPHYEQGNSHWKNSAIIASHWLWDYMPVNSAAPGCTNIYNGCWFTCECMVYDYVNNRKLNPDQYRSVRYNRGIYEMPVNVDYSSDTWKYIYSEISAGRPVIIWGWKGAGSGHAAVITGYKGIKDTDHIDPGCFTVNNPWYSYSTKLPDFLKDWPNNLQLITVDGIANIK